jgi:hypothetical protein
MALISVYQLTDKFTSRRRPAAAGEAEPQTSVLSEYTRVRHQLMAASPPSSISSTVAAGIARHPGGRSPGYATTVAEATITELVLNRDTASVTGVLTTEAGPVSYQPQFVRTTKGQAAVRADGTITYTPWPDARRAAARPAASFRGADTDTLSLAAWDADGSPIRVRARVPILAH